MRAPSRLRRALSWSGGVLGVATVLTVAIHLGPVRKAFGWAPLGSSAGGTNSGWCPFGFGAGGVHADGTVAVRPRPHTAPDPAKPIALARPALGFTLDVTTRADVQAWATAHDVACAPMKGGSTLECKDIPGALLPGDLAQGTATVWFSFPFDDKLEIVKTSRNLADPDATVAAFDHVQAQLTAQAGAPTTRDGAMDATELAAGQLRQAHVEFQFQNYRATMRATNMGPRGYVINEMYAAVL